MSKLTENQMHYFHFTQIIKTEIPKALRQVFKTMWDTNFEHKYGLWDDSPAVRSQFLALEGRRSIVPTSLSYEEWDATILVAATIFARVFSVPDHTGRNVTLYNMYARPKNLPAGSFYSCVLSPTGDRLETITLAIDQLRLLRNTYAHWDSVVLDKPTFDRHLQYVKDAFQALGISTHALDFLGNSLEFLAEELRDLTNNRSDLGTSGELIGRGSFGRKVHKFIHCLTGTTIAVKIVEIDPTQQEELKHLGTEINIVKTLRHERILPCYGGERKDDQLYLFMDYMVGGSLFDLIKQHGVLDESLSRKYTRQILEGVYFLHSKRIIHRDIKGPNILLDGDGNAKLADFGLARRIEKVGSVTKVRTECGTWNWMSPERLRGEAYGRKADIWSVGCTVFEMLTGKPPVSGESQKVILLVGWLGTEPKMPEGISQDALDILQASMARLPKDRPWSEELLTYRFVTSPGVTTEEQENAAS
ncbi:mitogen-activated protein kinase kinase kinase 3-like isoform X2 [Oculina patagonica]